MTQDDTHGIIICHLCGVKRLFDSLHEKNPIYVQAKQGTDVCLRLFYSHLTSPRGFLLY
jgi:hypothetical protein